MYGNKKSFNQERWNKIVTDTKSQECNTLQNKEFLIELYKSKFPMKELSGNESVTRL